MQMEDGVGENQLKATPSLGRIGIATNSFESTHYSRVMEAAANYLRAYGFSVLFHKKEPTASAEREAFAALVETQCDGYIFQADFMTDDEVSRLMQTYPNVVMVHRLLPSFCKRCIHVDNIAGGEIAARFLVAQGHRRIGMVRGHDSYRVSQDRATGFHQGLNEHDIELEAEVSGNFSQASGEQAMMQIYAEHPDITAIFFQNDDMAIGALNACKPLDLKVPENLSFIGYDGIPMCEYVSPRLTSVQQPLRQMGEHAAQIVADLALKVEENKRAVGNTYTPVLAERESVSPLVGQSYEEITLTLRETECLTWTANGKTSWEISVILGVSESTATFHLRNAATKLGASNRAHAAVKALHLGLIKFPYG